jgi:hypothetical protein
MPTADKKNKTIAVVTYPGVALLDLVATKTVLDSLAMGTRYRSVTVGERTEPIASNTPMRIIPEKRFEESPSIVGRLCWLRAPSSAPLFRLSQSSCHRKSCNSHRRTTRPRVSFRPEGCWWSEMEQSEENSPWSWPRLTRFSSLPDITEG